MSTAPPAARAPAIRLTLPLKFRREEHANSCIEASSLFTIGAHAVVDRLGLWYVVIDVRGPRPDAVLRYLKQHMPGVEWQVSEIEKDAP